MKTLHLVAIPITLGIIATGITLSPSSKDKQNTRESSQTNSPSTSQKSRTRGSYTSNSDSHYRTTQKRRPTPTPKDYSLKLSPGSESGTKESITSLRQHSERRLAQLGRSLDLTPQQERRAYPLLVRSSPLFDSNIEIGGELSYPLSANEAHSALFDLLDQQQQDDLIEDIMAEKEWWEELVADLEKDLDDNLTTTTDDSTSDNETDEDFEEDIPETPAPGTVQESEEAESFNLFDQVGQ